MFITLLRCHIGRCPSGVVPSAVVPAPAFVAADPPCRPSSVAADPRVGRPGFRTQEVTLVTTLLDPETYPAEDLAALYASRWQVEVNLRHLKETMGMRVLHSKTVDGVRKELLVFALVYNLVRAVMHEAAAHVGVEPDRASFVDAWRWLRNPWDKPREAPDKPREAPDEPHETPDEPRETSDEPRETPDEPREKSDEPRETSDESRETSDEPYETSDEPYETSDEPRETSDEPYETSDEPYEDRNRPGDASGEMPRLNAQPPR